MYKILIVALLTGCGASTGLPASPPDASFRDLNPDCGHDGQVCCPGDLGYECIPDFACGGGFCRGHEVQCGMASQPCCDPRSGMVCDGDLLCAFSYCVPPN